MCCDFESLCQVQAIEDSSLLTRKILFKRISLIGEKNGNYKKNIFKFFHFGGF
jgi:hypothetical protein